MRSLSERRGLAVGVALALLAIALFGAAPLTAADDVGAASLAMPRLADDPRQEKTHFVDRDRREYDDEEDDYDDDRDYDEDDYDEDDEPDFEEVEIERMYVEMERASLETMYGAMELVEKVASIAADDDATAALAVVSIKDAFHDEAIGLLEKVVRESPSKVARRVARLQLAEIHGERDNLDKAREHLMALLFEGE